jgi:hypothetical protein
MKSKRHDGTEGPADTAGPLFFGVDRANVAQCVLSNPAYRAALLDVAARVIADIDATADDMTNEQRAQANALARRFKDNAHAAIMRAARAHDTLNADLENLPHARKVRP